jgi:hypothetical protein
VRIGPFISNTVLSMVFSTAAFLAVRELKVVDPLTYLFDWLGISIGIDAFPSTADLSHLCNGGAGAGEKRESRGDSQLAAWRHLAGAELWASDLG